MHMQTDKANILVFRGKRLHELRITQELTLQYNSWYAHDKDSITKLEFFHNQYIAR